VSLRKTHDPQPAGVLRLKEQGGEQLDEPLSTTSSNFESLLRQVALLPH
jgi:hypothetical protein